MMFDDEMEGGVEMPAEEGMKEEGMEEGTVVEPTEEGGEGSEA